MSTELWSIIGVGVAVVGFNWRMYAMLRRDMTALRVDMSGELSNIKERLSHIEGWIQGRFQEGTTP